MKKIIIIFLFLLNCEALKKECVNPIKGEAILVAYRVSKHSHLWFENPKTGKVYDIGGVGGRREPSINLGDSINVYYCESEIVFDKDKYVQEPFNRETRFIYLNGYRYLYDY